MLLPLNPEKKGERERERETKEVRERGREVKTEKSKKKKNKFVEVKSEWTCCHQVSRIGKWKSKCYRR